MNRFVKYIFYYTVVLNFSSANAQTTEDIIDEAPAENPLEIYGQANLGHGHINKVSLKQYGDQNPLGNPIVFSPEINTEPNNPSKIDTDQKTSPISALNSEKIVQETLPQNPKISNQETPEVVNKQIQNTLYYSGKRIYDIQSYPASDINYIETPNLNPTITTYPAY